MDLSICFLKNLCDRVGSTHFAHNFYLCKKNVCQNDWQTSYSELNNSKKSEQNKPIFKENNWQYMLPKIKFEFQSEKLKFWKTCICHYLPDSFQPLKYSFITPQSPSNSLSLSLVTTNMFSISIDLLFPEGQINGIIHYVAFWRWLLSLSIIHLRFTHTVVCICSWFLFIAE